MVKTHPWSNPRASVQNTKSVTHSHGRVQGSMSAREPFWNTGVHLAEGMTDEELYAMARVGNVRAFDQLYARYERRLFGFVLRLSNDRAQAEEVFHDVLLS